MACSGPEDAKPADATGAADGKAADSQTADGGDAAADAVKPDATSADGGDSTVDAGGSGVLQAHPLRFEEDLQATWGSAADDVWVVGAKGRLLHWNGHVLAPRDSGTQQALYGIGGRAANDVWLAGDNVLLHWNGLKLQDMTPKDSQLLGTYRSVSAPLDGSTVLVAGDKGLVIRLLGDGTWKRESTLSSMDLQAIAAVDAALVWAVGPQGQALKLSGGSWSSTQMPKAKATLRAVAAAPLGRLFAAGDGGYLAATDQGQWSATLANDPQARDLHGMWAPTDDEAWAIGSAGALLHFVGKKWQLEDIAGTYMKTRNYLGMWGTAGGSKASRAAFAFGEGGAGVTYVQGLWQDFRAETTADLRAVAAAEDGGLYACGQSGLLLKAASAGAPFYDLAVAVTAADLNDVTAASGLWAVGAGGVVVNGSKVEMVPGGKDLFGIARFGSDVMVAVGDAGTLFTRSLLGGGWVAQASTTQLPLRGVASSGSHAFAVGDFGTILHSTGSGAEKWVAEDSGVIEDLRRVVAWGDGEAMAVGSNGLVLLRQQGKWTTVFQAPGSHLYGVARKADGTLIAVGFGGALVTGKVGGKFVKLDGGPSWLLGVAAGSGGVIAVGTAGSLFTVGNLP